MTVARKYYAGMGKAVADRTINRVIQRDFGNPIEVKFSVARDDHRSLDNVIGIWAKNNGYVLKSYHVDFGDDKVVTGTATISGELRVEEWSDVARRVSFGNSLLEPRESNRHHEFLKLNDHMSRGTILMSGRHLQHGDADQLNKPGEVFTNCATSTISSVTYLLLLNGAGVGSAYDDDLMVTDWCQSPLVIPVCDENHPDVLSGEVKTMDRPTIEHLYGNKEIIEYEVEDSREGWGKAALKIELMAFRKMRDVVLVMDFSKVRCRNSKIKGMQDRPATGPGPLIAAIEKLMIVRESGMPRWRAAMYVDHFLSESVLVGGVRRAARMATKYWRDPGVMQFISIKQGGRFLWSSNNSVGVDKDFWRYVKMGKIEYKALSREEKKWADHAVKVFKAVCKAAYFDGTGEPGFINQDRLSKNETGLDQYKDGNFAGYPRFDMSEASDLMKAIVDVLSKKKYKFIVNPCGEIVLLLLGAYCTIADVVPFHADNLDDAENAFRVASRALIRTNLMEFLYGREVTRTNRIGVGFTGIHEFAWKFFGVGWKDLVRPDFEAYAVWNDDVKNGSGPVRAAAFWKTMNRFSMAVKNEVKVYSDELGVVTPHTDTTVKPAGTTSKLFGLSEGAHLPPMREYIRWVQFRTDSPELDKYIGKGYPMRSLKNYGNTTIVGFPTQPVICTLGMGDELVTAPEATMEEQFTFLKLLEKYWIVGVNDDGVPMKDTGNQISYTLKYDPNVVSYDEFEKMILDHQSEVKACSVMPVEDVSSYEYLPEQAVSMEEFINVVNAIENMDIDQDVGKEHVDCANGVCPVDFSSKKVQAAE